MSEKEVTVSLSDAEPAEKPLPEAQAAALIETGKAVHQANLSAQTAEQAASQTQSAISNLEALLNPFREEIGKLRQSQESLQSEVSALRMKKPAPEEEDTSEIADANVVEIDVPNVEKPSLQVTQKSEPVAKRRSGFARMLLGR